jgi:hypothetical protein
MIEELLEQRTLHTWHGGEVTFVFMPPRDSLVAAAAAAATGSE